jgi:hypothetical protein
MAARKSIKQSAARTFAAALEALPFVARRKSRYGHRDAFYLNRSEIAHFHSSSVIDLRLGWQAIKALKDAGEPALMFRDGRSDWVEIDLKALTPQRAAALARQAYEGALIKAP